MKKDDIIGGVFLMVALLGLGSFFLFAKSGPELSYGPVEVTGSALAAVASGENAVDVTATLIEPGFVTIHQSIGGAPGPIIGSSKYMDVGVDVSTVIALTEAMDAGIPYIALLHVDNGDERFVVSEDKPVTSGGVSVRADFVLP
jgi:hypothetical protein